MTDKAQRPPNGEPFVWLTRELMASDAWRSAGINTRRFIDFLHLENMRHAGKQNGRLKAPRHQLHPFGISERLVTGAIAEAEKLGLIKCYRAGMRVATTYALTWLPLHDDTPASNSWRLYRNPLLKPLPVPKIRNLTAQRQSALTAEVQSDEQNLTVEVQSDDPKNLTAQVTHPSRKLLTTAKPSLSSGRLRVLPRRRRVR